MDSATIIALVTALGLGSAVPALVNGLMARLSGRAAEARARDADALAMRDDAWEWAQRVQAEADERVERAEAVAERRRLDMDCQAARADRLQEYAAWLRALLVGAGMPPADLPPWPDAKLRVTLDEKSLSLR